MKSSQFLEEGFVEDAHNVHQDHEVQMAREELYHSAESALRLHKLLRNVSEEHGLEGWVSAKITLANDYLKTVLEYMEYHLMTDASGEGDMAAEPEVEMMPVAEGSNEWPNFGSRYAEELAQKVFDANPNFNTKGRADELLNAAFPIMVQDLGSRKRANYYFNYDEDFSTDFVSAYGWLQDQKQGLAEDTSAGNVATVNNPTPKNKAKTGTLFGGTYQQPKAKAKK